MKLLPLLLLPAALLASPEPERKAPVSLHDFTLTTLDGQALPLAAFKGKVVLAVNVASACGYTPQYAGLQRLHETYGPRGLVVLGLPCNQFGAQEPGSAEEIQAFCSRTFGVTFPLTAKLEVKGPGQAPVYAFLSAQHGVPKWNFHKYLVGKDGKVLQAFPSAVAPEDPALRSAIEAALAR